MSTDKKYPFKFLNAYNQTDTDIFFGRDEEIKTLYDMVFQNAMVLVYGASGTGKTSLIQCGLAGKFKSYDWLPIMVRRGDNINDSLKKILLQNFDHPNTGAETSSADLSSMIRNVYLYHFRPVYLIFDQFEELFILGTIEEQRQFIEYVKEILQVEQPVKIIFSIREEYLGYLYDFERAVPQLLRKKLRVEPMTIDKVTDVLTGINNGKNTNVHIKENQLPAITEGIFNRLRSKQKTLTIQLPYLQVFLDKLYLSITNDESRKAEALITSQTLEAIGDIGDVLRDFLEEQVRGISTKLSIAGNIVSTDTIWKILSPFSTLEGTKVPMQKAELHSRLRNMDEKLTDACVEEFVNRRIMNPWENTGRYELAHDSLAKCIAEKRSDEDIVLLEIRRLINNQVSVKQDAREPFTEKQLNFIEPHLAKLNLNEEEDKLIRDSEDAVKKQKNKKKRRLQLTFAAMAVVLVVMAVLTIQANVARKDAVIAQEQAKNAQDSAILEREKANASLSKFLEANSKFLNEKAAKERTEFGNLEKRANTIINGDICPEQILKDMTAIASEHPDSVEMKSKILNLKKKCP